MSGFFRSIACLVLLSLCSTAALADWPHPRGPAFDGRLTSADVFPAEGLGLQVAWKKPLGSGYSGIAVAQGRLVTMFSDGESDHVVALDLRTGRELWRRALDATYRGHDGSDDGPLGSPVIDDGRVFVVAPRGKLAALKLADGSEVWSRSLAQDFGAEAPFYGFSTTPLVEGDVLVVQTGGPEGKSVSGLDKRSGKLLWSRGDEKVDYQSPAAMVLAGRRQIVAVAGKRVMGLDPKSGELLWEHALGEKESAAAAQPTFLGDDRFLIFVGDEAVAFKISSASGAITAKELYRSRELGNTYAAPVVHDDHLYGFRGEILTCARADSGEKVWKSREPGGRGLILVDGRLVIFGARGNVVVARATPEGYDEQARIASFERSGFTWPSFAGELILVRNLEQIAAIGVVEGAAGARAEAAPRAAPAHEFGKFVEKLGTSQRKAELLDEFMRTQESFPIVEGSFVHFVYRGEAEDVAITGNMTDWRRADALQRIAGTDLYHRSYELSPLARWEYRFVVDYETQLTDPLNPRTVPARWDETGYSELVMPGYRVRGYLAEPEDRPRGRLEAFTLNSAILGDEREIKVYLPPGYDGSDASLPVLIVNDGPGWLDKGRMANSLDNLIGHEVGPLIAVFVPPAQRWWQEAGGGKTGDYVRMLVEELLPQLAARYRVTGEASGRAVMGIGGYGLAALYAGLAHPELFGNAAAQSVSLRDDVAPQVLAMIGDGKRRELDLYLDWNVWEDRNTDLGYDLRQDGLNLATLLAKHRFNVSGGEVNDGAGWGGWRARTHRILEAFFPPHR